MYKNTLTKRALDELNIDMDDYLAGPSAISFGTDEISIVKVLNDFAKDHKALELKAGIIEGKHGCMTARGVKSREALTRTACLRGAFSTNSNLRSELYSLIKKNI